MWSGVNACGTCTAIKPLAKTGSAKVPAKTTSMDDFEAAALQRLQGSFWIK
jgi:hypothetical protein